MNLPTLDERRALAGSAGGGLHDAGPTTLPDASDTEHDDTAWLDDEVDRIIPVRDSRLLSFLRGLVRR